MKQNLKSILLASLFVLLNTVSFAQSYSLADITKSLLNPKGKDVIVVMHRGDWRNAPENSIKAIENSIKLGADMVEIDIQRTKDGEFILMHDKTLNRTSNGKGLVADIKLAEVRKLRLKSGIGVVTDHKIPTLEEAMLVAKDKILVNIDKGEDHFSEVYKILERTKTVQQVVLKSGRSYDVIAKEKGADFFKKVIFMPVVNLDKPNARAIIDSYAKNIKPVAFELVFNTDTSQIINQFKALKKAGSRVWVNTLWASLNAGHHDDLAVEEGKIEEAWGWVIDKGANIIQTDRPYELIQYLKRKNLHR